MKKYLITVLLIIVSLPLFSQLCQGTLGDPIVNITFGAGNNPGPALAAAATGYTYYAGDCPTDGSYTVRSNSSSCFSSSWHSFFSDHTGNANGYFMLVNASIQPSVFYVDTVKGLCGNNTYEFAAWIMNVLLPTSCGGNGNQPNISFTIEKTDGTILQTYNSGTIATTSSPIWKQYGFFFTSPPSGSDIILRMVNNAPGGCGNDLALDDITFRPCGPQITPSITGQPTGIANICEGSTETFDFSCTISPGFVTPVFQWQQRFNNSAWADIPGAITLTLTTTFTPANIVGNYEYRLMVAESGNMGTAHCRILSQPISVVVNANPVASANNNGPVCVGKDLTLSASGGASYLWTGPNGFTANTANPIINNISTNQTGLYAVVASSAVGCKSTATTTAHVNAAPIATLDFSDTSICLKDSVQFLASGGINYNWNPTGSLSNPTINNPKASPDVNTIYSVIVSNSFGCIDTAYIDVKVFEKAIANAGPDQNITAGSSTSLSGSIQGTYLSFLWAPPNDFGNTQTLNPVVTPSADASYYLTVISNNGCGISTDTVMVKFYKGIYIPNAFTPNNDGLNDKWNIPELINYPNFELFVYNRYGEVVFKNSKKNKPWDGMYLSSPQPTGIYPYVLKLNVANLVFKGTVMIFR